MFQEGFQTHLDKLKAEARYRELSRAAAIDFTHNDYLGISKHPEILSAGKEALGAYGSGSRGARLLGGNSALHEETEHAIAEFFGAPASLFFSTGYLANIAAVKVLSGFVEEIVSDEKIHASLIDGIAHARSAKRIVPHGEWGLQAKPSKPTLIVTESLFSMDGDFCDFESLKKLVAPNIFFLIDEAHAAGVFGPAGRGLSAGFADWSQKAVVVTFGKAFGVSGAAILCSKSLKEVLINTARPFIYSTAPAPVILAMVKKSLEVVRRESWRREELISRSVWLREYWWARVPSALRTDACSMILPLHIPGENRALAFSRSMRESGIELRAIRYPTVPKGSERVRVSVNLSTSQQDLLLMAQTVEKVWTAFS